MSLVLDTAASITDEQASSYQRPIKTYSLVSSGTAEEQGPQDIRGRDWIRTSCLLFLSCSVRKGSPPVPWKAKKRVVSHRLSLCLLPPPQRKQQEQGSTTSEGMGMLDLQSEPLGDIWLISRHSIISQIILSVHDNCPPQIQKDSVLSGITQLVNAGPELNVRILLTSKSSIPYL